VSLHFGLLHPDRVNKLVIIDAMLPVMMRSYRREDWEGWGDWAEMVEKIAGVKVPREKWQDVREMLTHSLNVPVLFGPFRGRPRNKVPITRLLTETSIVQDFDCIDEMTIENLSKIVSPTLLIYETDSPFAETYQVLCEQLPHATGVLLPKSQLRPFSPLQQPELFLQHPQGFLEAICTQTTETSASA